MALARSLLLLLALTLGGAPTAAADKLTVILDWFVNPDHGPLIVAREQGFFAAQDLEVELVAPADPNDPPKLVAAPPRPIWRSPISRSCISRYRKGCR